MAVIPTNLSSLGIGAQPFSLFIDNVLHSFDGWSDLLA